MIRNIKKHFDKEAFQNEALKGKKIEHLIADRYTSIMNGKELINYPRVPRQWERSRDTIKQFERMRKKTCEYFEHKKRERTKLDKDVADLEEQLSVAEAAVATEVR